MDSLVRNEATVAQIQRLEDAVYNPLNGKAWPASHTEILSGRRGLPVYRRYQEILDAYHQSQVVILSSETGSGKSTQVPQLLLYDEYASGLTIACTQPRRLAATELASRVAEELGVTLGEEVGYKIGGDQLVDKNLKKTRLVYMTEGVLVRQLCYDRNLSAYSCIIIDEAHERTADLDLLLALLKKAMNRRKDLKVVIMSATIDAGSLQKYFGNCPLMHITGRNFNFETLYVQLEDIGPSFVTQAAMMAVHIHQNKKAGHILVFLPGAEEIENVCRVLRKYTTNLDIYPLYSMLSVSEQAKALNSSGPNRKCIVSTNIAETSLTISNVVYVIDTGLSRQLVYNPRLNMHMLALRPISQASARQRAGRAGRTSDGFCYRLYSKEFYDNMDPFTEPEIRRVSLDPIIPRLVATGYRKVVDFDWFDAPHPESISRAVQNLRDWRFLDDEAKTTPSGRLAAKAPLDPIWFRAILVAAKFGCAMNMVDIAVLCSSQKPIFMRPTGYRMVADLAKTAFAHPQSDHITLVNAFNAYLHKRHVVRQRKGPTSDIGDWCVHYGLDMATLDAARIAREDLLEFLDVDAKLKPSSASIMDMVVVRKALAIAFCTHTAIRRTHDTYRTVHDNTPALLSPLSSLSNDDCDWVMYTKLHRSGGKQYLQTVTAISPEWLVDLPFFKDDRLPKSWTGSWRQPKVKHSLENAKAAVESSKGN